MKERNKINNFQSEINPNPIFFEDKIKLQMFEELNFNALNNIYSKEDSAFKKNIDKLNLKFYSETNKFLGIKSELEKSQDNLFIILFKQISSYIEEIEKLNIKLKEKEEKEKNFKSKIDEISKKEELSFFKIKIRNLEKSLVDKNYYEEKLKKEIESYKRQLNFYKEKMKIDISNTAKRFENFGGLTSAFEPYRGNISPNKSRKHYNTLQGSKVKKILVEESLKKESNIENTSQIENGLKVENKERNFFRDEIVNGDNSVINVDNYSKISTTKIHFDKSDIQNNSNIDNKNTLNNSSFRDKSDNSKLNIKEIKKYNESKLKNLNSKKKFDEKSLSFKKLDDKSNRQASTQSVLNLKSKSIERTNQLDFEEVNDIFSAIASNLDDELDLLRKEEKFLNVLKKEINNNLASNPNFFINPQTTNPSCNNISNYFENENLNLFDFNHKNDIMEITEHLEDFDFSDIDNKLNKIEMNTNNSIIMEKNHIKNIRGNNIGEDFVTKINFTKINNNIQNHNKLTKKRSQINYNNTSSKLKAGIMILTTPKKTTNLFTSNTNKKEFSEKEEKKINQTVLSKNKNSKISSKNILNKSVKK